MSRAERRRLVREQKRMVREASMQQAPVQLQDTPTSFLDHDPGISVEVTETDVDFCIRVNIENTQVLLHTRSAIDLSQKLQKAIADWISVSVAEVVEMRKR